MKKNATVTTDHYEVREWAELRGGTPAVCVSTRNGEGGALRINFGEGYEPLKNISWDAFFRLFEEDGLAFVYGEGFTHGIETDSYRFVPRSEQPALEREEEVTSYDLYSE